MSQPQLNNEKPKLLAIQANEVADEHNEFVDQKTMYETKPILDKIFQVPTSDVRRDKYLDVYPLEDKQFVNDNSLYQILFNLKGHHIQYLMNEGFHVRYDPTDSCHRITW